MKTIIQLAVVALLLNAGFQTARSYYSYYDFKAKLAEEIHHARVSTTSELHQRVIDLGGTYGLTVEWDNVQVRLEEPRTVVQFSYVDDVPFVPKYYYRHWPYEGTVSAVRERPLINDERR